MSATALTERCEPLRASKDDVDGCICLYASLRRQFVLRPVVLVWSEHFERVTDAIAVERQLKGWSRAKKDALLRSDWAKVIELSRRRAGKVKSG